MSENNKYPARGEMSADGKFYTHTDGTVHKHTPYTAGYFESGPSRSPCDSCSMLDDGVCQCVDIYCSCVGGYFELVSGAYVPTEAEAAITEACEMARAMVKQCSYYRALAKSFRVRNACESCSDRTNRTCPARRYLAKHGATDAWAADMEGGC